MEFFFLFSRWCFKKPTSQIEDVQSKWNRALAGYYSKVGKLGSRNWFRLPTLRTPLTAGMTDGRTDGRKKLVLYVQSTLGRMLESTREWMRANPHKWLA